MASAFLPFFSCCLSSRLVPRCKRPRSGEISSKCTIPAPSSSAITKYYIFSTGQGIPWRSSTDKVYWTYGGNVFVNPPSWTTTAVPGFTGFFWAPDVFYLNGRYCLYYAVSTPLSQVSAIGLVTNPTLDPTSGSYLWTDQGPVITSTNGSPYNTIDPSVMIDASGNPWLSFGSYYNGIYVVQLDPATGLQISSNSPTYKVAYNSSIEASCLFRHGGYYYLVVDWGSCCDGVNSTYNLRIGRSTSVTGPYLDRSGNNMVSSGGSLFLQGTGKFTGPGQFAILSEGGNQWFSYHYYDAGAWGSSSWDPGLFGVPHFDLEPLSWSADNWPYFTNDWSAVYNFQKDARDDNGQYSGLLINGASIQTDTVHGRVLNLNGTNQYVQLPPGVGFAGTYSTVVKWNGGEAGQHIFDFGVDTNKYVMLTPDSSADCKLRCDIHTSSGTQTIEASGPMPSNVWMHVAVTLDGQQGILYTNGVPVATNAADDLVSANLNATNNYLGKSQWPADPYFNGQISSLRIFSWPLSAQAVVAPQITIAQPAQGALFHPSDTINFSGNANDFYDASISATGLTWTVQWRNGSVTNVLTTLRGVTNGSFSIPSAGILASATYRIMLAALDSASHQSTNFVDVFPASSAASNSWASYYPFTSNANDASNKFNGTLNGGASIQTDPTRGNVLNLSGTNQYVSFPTGIGSACTFSGWVLWRGGGAAQRIFDFGRSSQDFFYLSPYDSEGNMQCGITTQDSNYLQTIEAPALPVNVWTYVAVAMNGREGILYTNGQAVAVNNSVNLLPSDVGATANYFGKSQFSTAPYFNGELSSVKINSQMLSLGQIMTPSLAITVPASGTLYAGGNSIAYAGVASDFSGALLSPSAYTWSVGFYSNGITVPFLGPVSGATNGTLQIPTNGSASTNVFYQLNLAVTDTYGNQQATYVDILPVISALNLATVPAGLQLSLDGQSLNAPTSILAVAGMSRTLNAPSPQSYAGSNYNFVVWFDGGAQTHAVLVPTTNHTFTASYLVPLLNLSAGNAGVPALQWPAWSAPYSLWSTTNLSPPVVWSQVTDAPVVMNGNLWLNLPTTNGSG